jgi:hypothetical protein
MCFVVPFLNLDSRTVIMQRAGIVLVLVVGCFLVGCRRSTSYTAKDGTRATVTQNGKSTEVTIQGKDGAKVQVSGEGNLALPDAFPKDVPVYPGAAVTANVTTKDGMQVMFKTTDSASKVAAFYNEKLKAGGFEIEATMNTGQGSMVTGKKDNRNVMVTTGGDSGGTVITLLVRSEEHPRKE